jgi:hypothetical protein
MIMTDIHKKGLTIQRENNSKLFTPEIIIKHYKQFLEDIQNGNTNLNYSYKVDEKILTFCLL